MKKEKEIKNEEGTKDRTIDRKEAIKKAGYIALSAATMMMLISAPKQAMASPASPSTWP